MDWAAFCDRGYTRHIVHCIRMELGYLQNLVYFPVELCPKLILTITSAVRLHHFTISALLVGQHERYPSWQPPPVIFKGYLLVTQPNLVYCSGKKAGYSKIKKKNSLCTHCTEFELTILYYKHYRGCTGNIIRKNSDILSVVWMHWLMSARAWSSKHCSSMILYFLNGCASRHCLISVLANRTLVVDTVYKRVQTYYANEYLYACVCQYRISKTEEKSNFEDFLFDAYHSCELSCIC